MNYLLSSCIDGVQLLKPLTAASFHVAQFQCASLDGFLPSAVDGDALNEVSDFFMKTSSAPLVWFDLNDVSFNENLLLNNQKPIRFGGEVVPESEEANGCFAVDLRNLVIEERDCQTNLPFVCQISCEVQEEGSMLSVRARELQGDFVFRGCVVNQELYINRNSILNDDAITQCAQVGGRLAIPNSVERLNEIKINADAVSTLNKWVGIRDFAGVGGNGNAKRFIGSNFQQNPFSHVFGVTPWFPGEPNDSGSEDCVEMASSGLFNDHLCPTQLRQSVCERYCGVVPPFVFGQCINNIQYYFNNQLRTFVQAHADCETQHPDGTLAIPFDAASFDRIRFLFRDNKPAETAAWVGLRDFRDIGGAGTLRFQDMNGNVLPFINVGTGIFPWSAGEPNDLTGQKCGNVFPSNYLLDDKSCANLLFSVCQRPCVTDSPTPSPSRSPSRFPTPSPSQNPTNSPTKNPTIFPTQNPTASPSENPTVSPSQNPSASPSQNPTLSPSENPTSSPSKNPTANPTVSPTSSCRDGLDMFVNPNPATFSSAQDFCVSQGGSLALPSSIGRFVQIDDELELAAVSNAFVGLFDPTGNNVSGVTDRFLDLTGQGNGFTSGVGFVFPWLDGTDPNALAGEDCILFRQGDGIGDIGCFGTGLPSVCEKYCGTNPPMIVGECVDDFQLYFNPELKSFDEAQTDCRNFDELGNLAKISSETEIARVANFLLSAGSFSVWVGLRDFDVGGRNLDPNRFKQLDGSPNFFSSTNVGEFPWDVAQPDPVKDEFCVNIFAPTGLLRNEVCEDLLQSICQRPCTLEPTNSPTINPTRNPTGNPTFNPTKLPTTSPTQAPTSDFVFGACEESNLQLYRHSSFLTFDYDDAAFECERVGGRIAIPSNSQRFQLIKQFNAQQGVREVYLGVRDFANIGGSSATRFLGSNFQPNPFSHRVGVSPWRPGEPNDFAGVEKCADLVQNDLMNDIPCDVLNPVLCERYCGVLPDFVVGDCIDDIQYYFNPELRTFDGAQADCEAFDPLGRLAVVRDAERFQRIQDIYLDNRPDNREALVGLRDFFEVGGLNTARFLSMDGEVLPFTSGQFGQFPWNVDRPNDLNGNQDCGVIRPLLDDGSCTDIFRSVCERPCISPTTSPTDNPTSKPTTSPTKNPTGNPTFTPTENPTTSPTFNPTSNPTFNPTFNPTQNPTGNPTENPTLNPTSNPTLNPTFNPTKSPSFNPTENPTFSPTFNPTIGPTVTGETFSPTPAPTESPLVSAGQCERRKFGFANTINNN